MIQKLSVIVILSLVVMCPALDAVADILHPSRVRLVVNAENDDFRLMFAPKGELTEPNSPTVAYFGYKTEIISWLTAEPTIGYYYGPDEVAVNARLLPQFDDFWGWIENEVTFPSYNGYGFAQFEYVISETYHTGIESEYWGNYENGGWSYGGAANFLLRFGNVGFDLVFGARYYPDGGWKPELVSRVLVLF